jgi:hypothetical protein
MFLKRAIIIGLVVLLVQAFPTATQAKVTIGDIIGYPFRWLGGQIFGGGVDRLKGATKETVADIDVRLVKHEERIGNIAGTLLTDAEEKVNRTLDRVDHGLEARILQIKTSADDSVDLALGKVDTIVYKRLNQFDLIGKGLIADAGSEVRKSLDHADNILRERTSDIDRMANELVVQADQALEARIAQIDEAAGRRLGNVDVIASKQRIAFERSAVRVAVLIGIVVFIVFVLRRLWVRYASLKERLEGVRGGERTVLIARDLAPNLLGSLAAAAAGAAVLAALYNWLPMDASQEADELTALHERELEASVRGFDFVRARFHASNLEFLKPESSARYAALADKAGLLRDLVARPGLLASKEAVNDFALRVRAVERSLGPQADPDILVMHAIVKWQTGSKRTQEYEAASFAARALRLSPRGFALAPLARAYVQTFLETPYVPEDVGLSRYAATLGELRESLAAAAADDPDSPLGPVVELAGMMRELERTSAEHYVKMIEAHAAIVASKRSRGALRADAALADLFEQRTGHARSIVEAWVSFDNELRERVTLNGPVVLAVFRMNDAVLTRARWFIERPTTTEEISKRIEELGSQRKDLELKMKLAPARIAWARRYDALLDGPARQVVEFEEAERFRTWERWTIEFEQAMVALEEARRMNKAEEAARWRVAVAASALSLYVGEDQRRPYADQVAGSLKAPPASSEISKRILNVPDTLEEALQVRGPRLI